MFDPAPEYVADKQKNKTQAYDFLIRVRNAALPLRGLWRQSN